jgi:hypothetical protein
MWRGRSRILRGGRIAEFEAWGLEFFMRSGSRILQGGLREVGGVVRKLGLEFSGGGLHGGMRKSGWSFRAEVCASARLQRRSADDLPFGKKKTSRQYREGGSVPAFGKHEESSPSAAGYAFAQRHTARGEGRVRGSSSAAFITSSISGERGRGDFRPLVFGSKPLLAAAHVYTAANSLAGLPRLSREAGLTRATLAEPVRLRRYARGH